MGRDEVDRRRAPAVDEEDEDDEQEFGVPLNPEEDEAEEEDVQGCLWPWILPAPGLDEDEEYDVVESTRSEEDDGGWLWPQRSHGSAPGAL